MGYSDLNYSDSPDVVRGHKIRIKMLEKQLDLLKDYCKMFCNCECE